MITFVISRYQVNKMPRGGYRKGSGRKPNWIHQDTTTVRVPTVLLDQVLAIAHQLDELNKVDRTRVFDSVTKSKDKVDYATKSNNDQAKVLDLRGIDINRLHGRTLVFLSDLENIGYRIEPKVLRDVVRRES